MNSVIAIGETVYDIIFRQGRPEAARAGGSMLNTAVSLGRCGLKVEMITELGNDHVGRIVMDFLAENGVSTSFISPVDGFKTPVSLAFLDENGNAQYSFYKNYPANRLNITWPEAGRRDVVLFGSFYSLNLAIREKIVSFVKKAKQNGALIIYDPNIRKNHLEEVRELMHLVEENIALADIVRGSDEDFENLFGLKDAEEVYKRIKRAGCKHLIITRGEHEACLFSDETRLSMPAKSIAVVSTIGAGDAFNAGIIFGIIKKGLTVNDLVDISRESWMELIGFGITFASDVCRLYDNYISCGIKL
jgi:fructokinase